MENSIKKDNEETDKKNVKKINKIITWIKNPYNIAFLILLIFVIKIYVSSAFIDSIWLDETQYMWEAQLTQQNPSYFFNIPGFSSHFPMLMIILFDLFTTNFNAARLMGLFFGIIGIIFAYLLGTEIKNRFVGLTTSALVAFHVWYRFLSMKGLVDTPVTAMCIVYFYFLFMSIKYRKKIYAILTIITAILTIYSKFSGIIIIPITIAILAIITITKKDFNVKGYISKNKKWLIIALIISTVSYFIIPQVKFWVATATYGLHLNQLSNSITMLDSISNSNWRILFILGLVIAIIYRSKEYIIAASIPFLYLTLGSIAAQGQALYEIRYFLPAMPFIYLLSMMVIDEIFQISKIFIPKLKNIDNPFYIATILIIMILVILPTNTLGRSLIDQRSYTYSGYLEAMDWVHDNVPNDGKERISNFFACCDYNVGMTNENDIRRTNNTPQFFQNFEDFKTRVNSTPQETIYLMADAWEPGQPQWLRPMDQQKFDAIQNLGFQVVYVVERPVPTSQGLQNGPAIIIFKKN